MDRGGAYYVHDHMPDLFQTDCARRARASSTRTEGSACSPCRQHLGGQHSAWGRTQPMHRWSLSGAGMLRMKLTSASKGTGRLK